MLAAMARQVALAVTVDVQPAHHATALDRRFQIPVWTVASFHGTSTGSPTLTATNVATAPVIRPRYAPAAILVTLRLAPAIWSLTVSMSGSCDRERVRAPCGHGCLL